LTKKTVTLYVESPFGCLGATYAVHFMLIGKPVVDFLFVLIELFSLVVTTETLRANNYWKSAFLKPKFQVDGDVHHQPFLQG